MNPTNIEWTNIFGPNSGLTWNPIVGCTEGCPYCYARRQAKRQKHNCELCYTFTPHLHSERLEQPIERKKPAGIFLGSMTDLWDPHVPQAWRDQVWDVVARCPQHVFWVLTKQPQNVSDTDNSAVFGLENLWVGVSCDGSESAASRPWLLGDYTVPVQSRFVSFEPLLHDPHVKNFYQHGPSLRTTLGLPDEIDDATDGINALLEMAGCPTISDGLNQILPRLHWLIVGAQTGPGAVLPERAWVETITEEADLVGLPVFLKDNLAPVMGDNLRQEWPERMMLNV